MAKVVVSLLPYSRVADTFDWYFLLVALFHYVFPSEPDWFCVSRLRSTPSIVRHIFVGLHKQAYRC